MCSPLGRFRHRRYLGAAPGALGPNPPRFLRREKPSVGSWGRNPTEAGGREGGCKSIASSHTAALDTSCIDFSSFAVLASVTAHSNPQIAGGRSLHRIVPQFPFSPGSTMALEGLCELIPHFPRLSVGAERPPLALPRVSGGLSWSLQLPLSQFPFSSPEKQLHPHKQDRLSEKRARMGAGRRSSGPRVPREERAPIRTPQHHPDQEARAMPMPPSRAARLPPALRSSSPYVYVIPFRSAGTALSRRPLGITALC